MAMHMDIQKRRTALMLTAIVSLALELVAQQAAARSVVMNVQSSSQRSLVNSIPAETFSNTSQLALAIEIIPPHHVKSPFYRPNLTQAERVAMSAQGTRARAMRVSRRLTVNHGPFTSPGVYYSDEGEKYIFKIMIGTPARTFQVIADTGSDLCWVQCVGCSPCPEHIDSPFDPGASSTYSTVPCSDTQCSNLHNDSQCTSPISNEVCSYRFRYGAGVSPDHEADGNLSLETLALYDCNGQASSADTSFYFGCGLAEIGANFSGVDGLFGLGQGPLSLVSQLGSAIAYKFSHCLVDDTVPNLTSTLLFGSEGSLSLSYTHLLPNPPRSPANYFVDLQSISVGGVDVPIPVGTFQINTTSSTGGVFLDSGTTYTVLVAGAYDPVVAQLLQKVTYPRIDQQTALKKYGLEYCFDTSAGGTISFPAVAFHLADLTVTPNPNQNIFRPAEDDGSVYCLTFLRNNDESIIGNVWQQNFQIAYELDKRRVGFAATTCGSSST